MPRKLRVQLPDWAGWLTSRAQQKARDGKDYELHLASVEWALSSALDINGIEDFISLPSPSVEPFAHQVEDAILFFRRLAPRGLIADDVGLGKTITAGLIARELLDRGRIETVLIVCPRSLVEQWQEELDSKFAMKAAIGIGTGLSDLDRHPFWITTYDTARSRIDAIRTKKFDLLILDEGHALRNLFGQQNPPQRAKAFEQLMRGDAIRYCVMLTATPIQNRLWDIFSLLEIVKAPQPNPLGTSDRFRSTFVADQPARRLRRGSEEDFRRRVAEATIRTRRKDTQLVFPEREVRTEKLPPLPEEKAFIDDALTAILALTSNKLAQMTHARTLMSSPWAAAAAFEAAADRGNITGSLREQFLALSRRGRAIKMSAKIRAVVTLVKQSVKDGTPSRLIVFTQRLETLRHLVDALKDEGFERHVAIMQGGDAESNRRAIRDFMADPPSRAILLSTDTGAVGLNLQAGNIVVNYDLPWNPMLLEQRIGRVQRLGQRAQRVILYNLVLAGTIEEHVVLRLIEKLNLFNQAIGEMEELMGLCDYDENRSLEQVIMELIQKAAERKDIEQDLRLMEESRRAAEDKMREMREATDQALASLRPKDTGGRLEGLERVTPRLELREVLFSCLKRGGVDFREEPDGRMFVRLPGGISELVFDRSARTGSGEQAVLVAVPGTRAFEHITKQARQGVAQHVIDASSAGLNLVRQSLEQQLGAAGMILDDAKIIDRAGTAAFRVAIRAAVEIPTDRYETVFEIDHAAVDDGVGPMLGAASELRSEDGTAFPLAAEADVCRLATVLPAIEARVVESASTHESIRRFREFYEGRYEEDLARLADHAKSLGHAGRGADADSIVEDIARRDAAIRAAWESLKLRFLPAFRAEPVGVSGIAYDEAQVEVRIRNRMQRESGAVVVKTVPLTGTIKSPIPGIQELQTGAEGWMCPEGHVVAEANFVRCSSPSCTAGLCLKHQGAVVGARALWECAECQTQLCKKHRATCVNCEAPVCAEHARRLTNRGQVVCGTCCEELSDGSVWLCTEVAESAVSGTRMALERLQQSDLSGRYARPEELVECEESGRKLLPEEIVRDAVTGRRVASDLVERSAVSEGRGLRTRMLRSSWTGRACLPGEEALCDETGALLLPDEVLECSVTGRHARKDLLEEDVETHRPVLRRLLQRSDATGVWTKPDHLRTSQATGRVGLEAETALCEICHKRLLQDELVTCPETGRRACPDHFAMCEVSGERALPDSLSVCEASGKRVRRSLLAACAESGKRVSKDLLQTCEATGAAVLPEMLGRSSVSGKQVRQSLLVSCASTGQMALPEELSACAVSGKLVRPDVLVGCPETGARFEPKHGVACEETGAVVVPAAVGHCARTGKRVRRSLLGRDDLTGEPVIARLLQRCAITGRQTVAENLVASTVSGRLVLRDRAVACQDSGHPALPGELVTCAVSGKSVLPTLVMTCPETGLQVATSIAEPCDVTRDLCAPSGLGTCEATGKHVRRSRLGTDEVTGKLVLTDLLRPCEWTGRKTLSENLVRSVVSGKAVLSDIVRHCEETGAPALPEELVRCEVSGKLILPGLVEKCQVSGRVVLRRLLKTCESSGQRVLPEYLGHCRRSGKTVLASLIAHSEISGDGGLADLLARCDVTGRTGFLDELIVTEFSGTRIARDRLANCPSCGRSCDIGEKVRCRVCEQFYCPDDCQGAICLPCTGTLTKTSGRKLTSEELGAIAGPRAWVRRGWIVESAEVKHVYLESARFRLRPNARLIIVKQTESNVAAPVVLVERGVDKNLAMQSRKRVALYEGSRGRK